MHGEFPFFLNNRFSKKINLLNYKFCCFKTSENNNKIDNRIVF